MYKLQVNNPTEMILPLAESIHAGWPDARETAVQIVRQLYVINDHLEQQAEQMLHVSQHIACQKGCGWCCYIPVGCHPFELFYLAEQLSAEQKQRVLAEAERRNQPARRKKARRACPFLVPADPQHGVCSIYEHRPLRCQGYTSLDVGACKERYRNLKQSPEAVNGIPILPEHFSLHIFLLVALYMASHWNDFHVATLEVELVTGLAQVIREPDSFERWISGGPVFQAIPQSATAEQVVQLMIEFEAVLNKLRDQ